MMLGVLSSCSSDRAFSRLLGCWLLACVAVDLLLSWTCRKQGWIQDMQLHCPWLRCASITRTQQNRKSDSTA
jgi:hypothetical protein